jgi:hypothetical protein
MRGKAIVVGASVAAITMIACVKPRIINTTTVVPVDVTITCTGEGIQAFITPYTARLQPGDGIDWRLVASPNVQEISIDRKPGRDWPYASSPPYRGQSGNPAKGRNMKSTARGTYPYSISGICQPPGGSPRSVIIDPDMIIIRGETT